jgi:N-acetylglucosaminyldiphosphoundecaprenol N-acetyl-beta-D-mannosaminyltransferase
MKKRLLMRHAGVKTRGCRREPVQNAEKGTAGTMSTGILERKKTELLGLRFDAMTMAQAQAAAEALITAGRGGCIVTANPEIMMAAQKDGAYLSAINAADLVLADGVGDLYVARILGKTLPERVSGSDLVPRLLESMAAEGRSVFLYGAKPGVADRAGRALEAKHPGLRIAGSENGFISDETELWRRLENTQPDLLLLGLGAPRQELWMAANRERTTALMIGVGGLLDVFSGDVPRAPERWCRLGLEWLYRTIKQPKRIKRIMKLPRVLVLALKERAAQIGGSTGEKGE